MQSGQQRYNLVIHHHDKTVRFPWVRVDECGEADGRRGEASSEGLAALAARFPDDGVYLLVPMADVAIHRVQLPGKHDAAGMRTLPWLLEEKLASQPETIAIVPLACEGEDVWAAAVAGERLAQWTAPFSAAGIRLAGVIPDALALPLNAQGASALYWQGRWLLRTGRWQGAEVEPEWLTLWHDIWQREQTQPQEVICYGTPPTDLAQWRTAAPQEALALLARGVTPQTPSLLPPSPASRAKTWRMPLAAALTALILLFVQQGMQWRQTVKQTDAIAQQLRGAAHPGDGGTLTSWLTQLPSLPEGVTIKRLHYLSAPRRLRLYLVGNPAQIERVHGNLSARFHVQREQDGALTLTEGR